MNRKIIATASIIAIIAIVFTATSNSTLDESTISKTIFVDAVYEPESEIVKITYNDNSKKTNLATLEILGMEETFHKEFSQSSFIEIVQINSEPKYGWSTIPVVFSINHDEFGEIGLKTEIYEQGELKPRIIYSKI
jgi:inner membrane protein involved in colicin E2 resistance|tara:strand:+ start:2451 stop:2858 length:408 start_codon:yes stop_codon:yes gene_type:complete